MAAGGGDAVRGVRPACAVAMSPWTDLAVTGDSVIRRAHADPMLVPDEVRRGAARYLAGADAMDPRASPLWGDPAGLPPRQLHVGADEILLDDARRYAARGGAVELHVWDGLPHVFPAFVGKLDAAGRALDRMADFLATHLHAAVPQPA